MTFHSILLLCSMSPYSAGAGKALHSTVDCKPLPKLGTTVAAFSSNLRSVFQDRAGNYWFGSDGEGVSRYDGKTVVRITNEDGLPSNLVIQIQQD